MIGLVAQEMAALVVTRTWDWSLRRCRYGFLFFRHEDEYLRHVAALECCDIDINWLSWHDKPWIIRTFGNNNDVEVMGLILSFLQLLDVDLVNVHFWSLGVLMNHCSAFNELQKEAQPRVWGKQRFMIRLGRTP
jgi:hypothetical protein